MSSLPELRAAVEKHFGSRPPTCVDGHGKDRVEIWDAEDFDPWESLDWETVRVIRYRQHQPDGTVVQADWLTNFPSRKAGSLSLYPLLNWLLPLLALVIERLDRIRYLHRGTHPARSAEELCRLLWLGLSRSPAPDTSGGNTFPLDLPQ